LGNAYSGKTDTNRATADPNFVTFLTFDTVNYPSHCDEF
jgi:hypothetical protein